jgi:predicted nucleotidyltransferase
MPVDLDALAAAALDAVPAGLVSLYLFGSEALGRAHRDSDVDIAVLLDRRTHPTPAGRFDVRLALAARVGAVVRSPRLADIVVLNDAPPHLVRRVMTEGRRLYCADPEQDHAARRTALSRAADLEPFLRRMRRIKLEALTR